MRAVAKYSLIALAALAVLAAVAAPKVLPLYHASAVDDGSPELRAGQDRSPLKVTAVRVEPAQLIETVTATGTLLAEEGVELQAETNGKVAQILFREGARVRKGDLLVKLNDADLTAARARAQYRKELAELRERRIAQLLKQGVARQDEYDAALNEVKVQDAEIALTEAQIAKTEIRAPFDGVVGLRFVSEGAFVSAATRIATLQRLDRLKVDFSIPEKYAMRIRLGSAIDFTISGGERPFQGEIYAFDPRVDAATRTVLVRALCPNPGGRLLPGVFANVAVPLGNLSGALIVPAVAVVAGLNEKNVFVVRDGKVERRAVETGTRMESTVHILSGLQAGDTVVTSGLQQMRHGQAVIVLDGSAS